MDLNSFRIAVAVEQNKHPDWRIGQTAFNTLVTVRPDLAAKVRGSRMDPFYAHRVEDTRFVQFVTFLEENW